MTDMTTNELASVLVREAFHSFEIGDEFTLDLMVGIIYYHKIRKEVTLQKMKKKVSSFIQAQIKTGTIERVDGVKDGRFQVYQKVGDLLKYFTRAIDPIPPEYHDFVFIWNELDVGETVTAEDFHHILKDNGIETTYVGQSSKFLWIISDRGLADCRIDDKRNIYTRIDSIPESVLRQTATKFMRIPNGKYESCLDSLPI
jgi:hypothetical protein